MRAQSTPILLYKMAFQGFLVTVVQFLISLQEQERKKGLIRSKNAAKLMTVVVDARTNAIVLKLALMIRQNGQITPHQQTN